jgi:N-acetylglucosaminyl-diphospho-decaprenol L-rhamnosyltransferase
MRLTVSLLVHADFSHIAPALRSLYATTDTPCDVYVTINTRSDHEVALLRAEFPEADVLVNPSPQGFAANHNHVLRLAKTWYVALLNDDIILHDGALDTLVAYLESHPEVGVVGPHLENADGTPQVSVYSDPTLFRMLYKISGLAMLTHQQSAARRWLQKVGIARLLNVESLKSHDTAQIVPIVTGAVMVVRREAYSQVGLMDESTRVFGEEIDWHWRFRQASWQVAVVPAARVTHFGAGHQLLRLKGLMLIEDRKAILNYFLKHKPHWQAVVIRVAIVLFHAIWGILWLPFASDRARDHFATARMGTSWQRPPSREAVDR